MTPLDCLSKVLASPEWKDSGGLDASTMYGQLALAVAEVAIAAERSECAKIAEDKGAKWANTHSSECPHPTDIAESIAAAIRARGQT